MPGWLRMPQKAREMLLPGTGKTSGWPHFVWFAAGMAGWLVVLSLTGCMSQRGVSTTIIPDPPAMVAGQMY